MTFCSLRADRVGALGYRNRATTPRLDAFAADATRFTRAWANATWTNASHASILTGMFVGHHHVADDQDTLVAGLPTLAGVLGGAGWRAAASLQESTPMSLPESSGITRGFSPATRARTLGDWSPEAFAAWAAGEPTPFVGLVHLRAAHSPFGDGSPFVPAGSLHPDILKWQAGMPRMGSDVLPIWSEATDPHRWLLERMRQDPVVTDQLSVAYDSAVYAADRDFGRLLDALDRVGRLSKTIVVAVADHGESLPGHKDRLERDVLHIPLLIRVPGGIGHSALDDVSQVDLVPTLLELANVPCPDGLDGASLAPLIRGEPMAARPAFSQSITRNPAGTVVRREAIVSGGLRLVQFDDTRWDIEVEADGVVTRTNVRTAEADALHAQLQELGADTWVPAGPKPPVAEELRKQIQQSGYW
ncbi:MAG: hypothetical protein EXR71_20485 [Myxococcales bacterium]|nr:hypothetical protein [Myxococcales bacterium]